MLKSIAAQRMPIADLHCDLLCYLSRDPKRTPQDLEVRCSIPQLIQGNVKVQTMAIFAETLPGSSESGRLQAEAYWMLLKAYSANFTSLQPDGSQKPSIEELLLSGKIGIMAAVENASAFCDEAADLDDSLAHLTALQKRIGKLLYVSLTWNSENRFGGGAATKVGLKNDGKKLVHYLCRHGIALDFSHASDYLAFDLLNFIDREGLHPAVLASHSNLRSVANFPRNLPDDLAREIIKRKGVIGLNFIRYLLGKDSPGSIARHVEHLLSLGGDKSICFGADFFYPGDVSAAQRKPIADLFFPDYEHAGDYPKVTDILRRQLSLSEEMLSDLCNGNFLRFIKHRGSHGSIRKG